MTSLWCVETRNTYFLVHQKLKQLEDKNNNAADGNGNGNNTIDTNTITNTNADADANAIDDIDTIDNGDDNGDGDIGGDDGDDDDGDGGDDDDDDDDADRNANAVPDGIIDEGTGGRPNITRPIRPIPIPGRPNIDVRTGNNNDGTGGIEIIPVQYPPGQGNPYYPGQPVVYDGQGNGYAVIGVDVQYAGPDGGDDDDVNDDVNIYDIPYGYTYDYDGDGIADPYFDVKQYTPGNRGPTNGQDYPQQDDPGNNGPTNGTQTTQPIPVYFDVIGTGYRPDRAIKFDYDYGKYEGYNGGYVVIGPKWQQQYDDGDRVGQNNVNVNVPQDGDGYGVPYPQPQVNQPVPGVNNGGGQKYNGNGNGVNINVNGGGNYNGNGNVVNNNG